MNNEWKCTRPEFIKCVKELGHKDFPCDKCIWGEKIDLPTPLNNMYLVKRVFRDV